jgi:hypothetical protein
MLDLQTADWGVLVTLVGLKDIRLPDTTSERWHGKRTHPLEMQPRNLQTLVEIGVKSLSADDGHLPR